MEFSHTGPWVSEGYIHVHFKPKLGVVQNLTQCRCVSFPKLPSLHWFHLAPAPSASQVETGKSHRSGRSRLYGYFPPLPSSGIRLNAADLLKEASVFTGPLDVVLTVLVPSTSFLACEDIAARTLPNFRSKFLLLASLGTPALCSCWCGALVSPAPCQEFVLSHHLVGTSVCFSNLFSNSSMQELHTQPLGPPGDHHPFTLTSWLC